MESVMAACLLPLLRKIQRENFSGRTFLACCVMANLMTHPIAFIAIEKQFAWFTVVETFVFVAETISYRLILDFRWTAAWTAAAVTNAFTLFIGMLM
jgi:hypothetical protein